MHLPRLLAASSLLVFAVSAASAQRTVVLPAQTGGPVVHVTGSNANTLGTGDVIRKAEDSAGDLLRAGNGSDDALAALNARSRGFLATINAAINEGKENAKKDVLAARKGDSVAKPKKAQEGPSPYTDAEIVEMAKRLAVQYKGSPWSYTEYNSVLYPTLDHLRQQGVPERQLQLFKKTCDDHPGRPFNPWSGD